MSGKIYFRGSRADARQIARRLTLILTGREHDAAGIGRGVFLTIGMAALSDIKADFVRKADGGTGEDGSRWPPLSRKYLAYGRRFGSGEQAALKKAAGLGKQHRYGTGGNKGLLTKDQLKRWKKIFGQTLQRLLVSMPAGAAKARAAQIAWATLKRDGAQTKINVFGGRKVQMLRDTGILFNSLSPGRLGGGASASYTKPSGDGGDDQIMEAVAGGVIVGTNVPYAATHNHGDPTRGIPRRQFLPDPDRVPDAWKDRWGAAAEQSLEVAARMAYEVLR